MPAANDLPHITWCTTGPLSFLPLHAAGNYNSPGASLFDFAISSYTPTLSALLSPIPQPNMFRGIIAVGQESTPGHPYLPDTAIELTQIGTQAGDLQFMRLEGEKATQSATLAGMEEKSWVHFACHASQNSTDPTKSGFHLWDGALDLSAITQRSFKHADLAFLSACQTATGDQALPEEAVHLAAGMMMAGYPTVIATMWSIRDQDAPLIAAKVYACLLEGGVPNARRAAKALHIAVACLRDEVGVKSFSRWAQYIHMGR